MRNYVGGEAAHSLMHISLPDVLQPAKVTDTSHTVL